MIILVCLVGLLVCAAVIIVIFILSASEEDANTSLVFLSVVVGLIVWCSFILIIPNIPNTKEIQVNSLEELNELIEKQEEKNKEIKGKFIIHENGEWDFIPENGNSSYKEYLENE